MGFGEPLPSTKQLKPDWGEAGQSAGDMFRPAGQMGEAGSAADGFCTQVIVAA
jgi:hypothetical protein